MKQALLSFLLFACAFTSVGQAKDTALNFDFEKAEGGLPAGWSNFGSADYLISLDSTNAKSGRYSGCIQFNGQGANFKALAFTLPHNYAGREITLTGWIKTENVSDGYAGLWMRIDPSVAFDNMGDRGIKGTTDWQRYSVTLPMQPDKTTQIVLGGLLVGKGKMWLDDLRVTVDNKDLSALKPYQRKTYPAEGDKTFDKGSGIAMVSTDDVTLENLRLLGMIWGFVKYYHPAVAKGAVNWDYELFRILPKITAAKNGSERDAGLTKWINGLGSFEGGGAPKAKPENIKLQPDLDWIKSEAFSGELKTLLLTLKDAKRTGEHYYLSFVPGVGNPQFTNEKPYTATAFPDAGYCLLALFRYWNIIQYYFPNRHLIGEDWKGVLKEFLPKFINDANETDYTLTALELIARIHDTHANVWGGNTVLENHRGKNYAAAKLAFAEGKAVVSGYYNDSLGKLSGLRIGDVVTKINDRPVEAMVKERLPLTPASNYPTQLRDLAPALLRTADSLLTLEFVRDGKSGRRLINTYPGKGFDLYGRFSDADTCFKLLNNDIAYLNNGSLKRRYLPELWKVIKNTKGLIIDDRNYPSDFPIYDLSNYLMSGKVPFVKFSNGSLTTPGLFTFTDTLTAGKAGNEPYKGKVVILVNETSQSSAEFHAMAYRAFPGAVVIGSTTAGADGNVSSFSLPGGISTMISGIGVYYPDGKETQRVGIVPDAEIQPTLAGIKAGRDEVLEEAIKIINRK